MIGRIKRGTRIAASYANVFAELLAVEARQEARRVADRCRQKAIAIVLLLFAVVWLNVGVFVLIWDSPYRQWMPFAIGVGVALVALLVWQSGRASDREPPFAAARRALAEDAALWDIDLQPGHVLAALHPDAGARGATPPSSNDTAGSVPSRSPPSVEEPDPAELERQLRELRVALKRTVSGPGGPGPGGGASPGGDAGVGGAGGPSGASASDAAARQASSSQGFAEGFEPKSRTMRTLMLLVDEGVPPRGPDGGGAGGAWPMRIAALLLAGRLFQRHGRWLIAAWPVIRLVVAQMARSRRAERRADVGASMPDPTERYGPARASSERSDDAPAPFPGSTATPGPRPPPP